MLDVGIGRFCNGSSSRSKNHAIGDVSATVDLAGGIILRQM